MREPYDDLNTIEFGSYDYGSVKSVSQSRREHDARQYRRRIEREKERRAPTQRTTVRT